MAKRNQHFVPRLYLRLFASDPDGDRRQISLCPLQEGRVIHGASIRDQCKRSWFYGRDGKTEDALARLEDVVAKILHRIRDSRSLPTKETEDYWTLLYFLAIQGLRTSRTISDSRELAAKLVQITFEGNREKADAFFGTEALNPPVQFYLGVAHRNAICYGDLRPALLSTGKPIGFLTSDHPLALYNQYCEHAGTYWGTTGAAVKGLQVFFPITPSLCLLLFDDSTYAIPRRSRSGLVYVTRRDLAQINQLQVLSAEHSLFFPEQTESVLIEQALRGSKDKRKDVGPCIAEGVDEKDSSRGIIHQYRSIPNLQLSLSFLKLQKSSRLTPFGSRVNQYRPSARFLLEQLEDEWHREVPEEFKKELIRGRTYRHTRTI